MNVTGLVEHVQDSEHVARFVMSGGWIRADGTVRPDAFMPPTDLNLSVTRHVELSSDELWQRGRQVAFQCKKDLKGRADLLVKDVRAVPLDVVAAKLHDNPQHAHVVGWPPNKPAQKIAAQVLAAVSAFAPVPSS